VTYRLDMDVEFNSLKYVWNFLREEFPRPLYEEVRAMQKLESERGVVFNIPEEFRFLAEAATEKLRKNRPKFKGMALAECAVLPALEATDSEEYRLLREKKKLAMENKRQLEIFIGGVPYEMDEQMLRNFFADHAVNLFLVRILKDEKGFSKGIGFALCENHDHFARAIRLNASRLMDRTIRVKLADQRSASP
jgi:RNA recognition motif-containing protein